MPVNVALLVHHPDALALNDCLSSISTKTLHEEVLRHMIVGAGRVKFCPACPAGRMPRAAGPCCELPLNRREPFLVACHP
jgi:hypothetical protein